jgi:hypothetical protein
VKKEEKNSLSIHFMALHLIVVFMVRHGRGRKQSIVAFFFHHLLIHALSLNGNLIYLLLLLFFSAPGPQPNK